MLFATFWAWLSDRLTTYISTQAANTAQALEPAAVTFGAVYVMLWGFLHLRGQIEEPITQGLVRILTLIAVFGIGLHLWLYHDLLVDTFFTAPAQFAAQLIGGAEPVKMIDQIWDHGGRVAAALWDRAGLLSGDPGFYLAALGVYLTVGLMCVYTMFLISLSRIALAVLLALGPLFIVMTLFQPTRRYFDSWISELTNYALVTILTIMLCSLMLSFVDAFAAQTAARGAEMASVDAINLVLVTALVSLVMRQVLPISARLAGGSALSTLGAWSAVTQGARTAARTTRAYVASVFDSGDDELAAPLSEPATTHYVGERE
jgi:type IV secretion system protein VirB6